MARIRELGVIFSFVLLATAGTFAFIAGATRDRVPRSARPPRSAAQARPVPWALLPASQDPFAWSLASPPPSATRGSPVLYPVGACMDPHGMIHYSFLDSGNDRRPAGYGWCMSQSLPGAGFTTTPHPERRWFSFGIGW